MLQSQPWQQNNAYGATHGAAVWRMLDGQPALAGVKPQHDGAATGTVYASAQQTGYQQATAQQPRGRNIPTAWCGPAAQRASAVRAKVVPPRPDSSTGLSPQRSSQQAPVQPLAQLLQQSVAERLMLDGCF